MDVSDDDIDPKSLLSVDDLMALRKTRDLPVTESVIEKGYIPKESDSSHVKALLEDKRKLLELKSSARIGDLIQAKWRPDLKKAVTPKLKGKFTQHMGNFVNGNMVLCPEETMFLMERGTLELLSNGVPLSTEAAYSVVLNDDLALEKYMVYSYLSHLGFIVVQHREKLNYEKLAAISGKRKGKRKKKFFGVTSNKKTKIDKTSVANGVQLRNVKQEVEETLQSQLVEKKVEENLQSQLIEKKAEETLQSQLVEKEIEKTLQSQSVEKEVEGNLQSQLVEKEVEKTLQSQSVEKEVEGTLQSQLIEKEVEKTFPLQSVEKKVEKTLQLQSAEKEIDNSQQLQADITKLSSCMPNSSELNIDDNSIQEQPILVNSTITDKNDDVTVINASTADSVTASSPIVDVDLIVDENVKNDSEITVGAEIVQGKTRESNIETVVVTDVPDDAPSKPIDLIITANRMSSISESIDASIDNNSVELVDDETVSDADDARGKSMADTNSRSVKSKATDDGTSINSRNESSCLEKMTEAYLNTLNLRSDDDETSDSDVLCVDESSQDQEDSDSAESVSTSNEDSVQSVPDNDAAAAGDVVVLEVGKKEVVPLAVINLSSDEDEKSDDANEDDDDDVQIIEECNVTRPSCKRENWYPIESGSSEKREKSQLMMKLEGNRVNPGFSFPYLVRKRIVCLPRPPAHLLPTGVCLNKEAYTLDLKLLSGFKNYESTTRVWNSYKDLQNTYNFKNGYNLAQEFPRQGPSNSPQPYSNFNPFGPSTPFSNPQFPPFQNHLSSSPHVPQFNMAPQDHHGFNQGSHSPNLPVNTFHNADPSNCQYVTEGTPQMANNGRVFPTQSPLLHDPHAQQNLFSFIEEAKRNTPVQPSPATPWLRTPYNENTCRPPLSSNGFHGNQLGPLSDFESSFPFPGSNRNPVNPWMQNWRPAFADPQTNPFPPNLQPGFFPQRFMSQQWRPITENLYPCDIPKLPARVSSWQDLKSSGNNDNNQENNDEDDEVEEVPIDFDEVLWSKVIHPLVRPGGNLTLDEVLKTLQITKSADLSTSIGLNDRYLPDTCSLRISFDLYLPGSVYRKTCPCVPHNRIIVTRSTDPFPKPSEITLLLRKFKDNAVLQFAVVDDGDISFYSFNCVNLPITIPHQ